MIGSHGGTGGWGAGVVGRVAALLATTVLGWCGVTAEAAQEGSARKQPNIVFILADDLGWTDLSVYGSKYYETPNIDRMAAEGMRFTNGYSCAANCAPTRAALMTGQYAVHNGVYNVGSLDRGEGVLKPADQHGEHIRHEAVAMAETLRAAGYATCHVGKYHVSAHDDITSPGRARRRPARRARAELGRGAGGVADAVTTIAQGRADCPYMD